MTDLEFIQLWLKHPSVPIKMKRLFVYLMPRFICKEFKSFLIQVKNDRIMVPGNIYYETANAIIEEEEFMAQNYDQETSDTLSDVSTSSQLGDNSNGEKTPKIEEIDGGVDEVQVDEDPITLDKEITDLIQVKNPDSSTDLIQVKNPDISTDYEDCQEFFDNSKSESFPLIPLVS